MDAETSLDELIRRTGGIQPVRRLVHAVTGIGLAWGPLVLGWPPRWTAASLGIAAAALLVGDLLRLRHPALNRLFFRRFRLVASPREAARLASSTWYLVGAALVWGVVPGVPAVGALLVLGLADPAASVVGRSWGRVRWGKGTREGSLAFTAAAIAVLWPLVGPLAAVPVALLAAAAEISSVGPDDNLVVPVVAGMALRVATALPLS